MDKSQSCNLVASYYTSNGSSKIPASYPDWVTWLAFGIGLTGAVSLRLILIAKAYQPELIRTFWYIGVCGNMLFFLFRSYITHRRRRLIAGLGLIKKLQQKDKLCSEDYQALRYLVSSLYLSKEKWNYLAISVCSLAAIAWDLFI